MTEDEAQRAEQTFEGLELDRRVNAATMINVLGEMNVSVGDLVNLAKLRVIQCWGLHGVSMREFKHR